MEVNEGRWGRSEGQIGSVKVRCKSVRALRTWAFSDRLRGATEPPADLAAVVRWLQTATITVTELTRPGPGTARCRALLDRISRKQDGSAAAANTANRKRAVLNNLCSTRSRSVPCLPTRSRPSSGLA